MPKRARLSVAPKALEPTFAAFEASASCTSSALPRRVARPKAWGGALPEHPIAASQAPTPRPRWSTASADPASTDARGRRRRRISSEGVVAKSVIQGQQLPAEGGEWRAASALLGLQERCPQQAPSGSAVAAPQRVDAGSRSSSGAPLQKNGGRCSFSGDIRAWFSRGSGASISPEKPKEVAVFLIIIYRALKNK